MNHSKLRIASSLLAIGVWFYLAAAVVILFNTTYFEKIFNRYFSTQKSGMVDGFGDLAVAILLLLILFIAVPFVGHLAGFIFGLIGFLTPAKKKLFSVTGLVLNIFPFVILLILYLIPIWTNQ